MEKINCNVIQDILPLYKQKYLIETRLSGALTRVYSAIALEEPVAASSGGGSSAGTP